MKTFTGHRSFIHALTADSTQLFSGSADKSIRVLLPPPLHHPPFSLLPHTAKANCCQPVSNTLLVLAALLTPFTKCLRPPPFPSPRPLLSHPHSLYLGLGLFTSTQRTSSSSSSCQRRSPSPCLSIFYEFLFYLLL